MVNVEEKKIKDESPVRVKVIKPRIGKTCICPVCHERFPFKKREVILKPSKILTLITSPFLKFIPYMPNV